MRLALADVKKRISHVQGIAVVTPYLLPLLRRRADLDAIIGLFEGFVGQPRSCFPEDRPAELLGDYRLARGLSTCLLEWYEWRSPVWADSAAPDESQALAAAGIFSPADLRLALYDYVNQEYGGYVSADERELALNRLSQNFGIAPTTLARLLRLDGHGEALLVRISPEHPSADHLARRYNQRVVEALLSNASHIEWILPPSMRDGAGGGLGSVVKRICYLARRAGVHYDVSLVPSTISSAQVSSPDIEEDVPAAAPLQDYGNPLSIVLYGPPEVTGAPAQYGDRLARLTRRMLGYSTLGENGSAWTGGEFSGTADVYLHGRKVALQLDSRLMSALGREQPPGDAVGASVEPDFDSSLEHDLYADFAALAAAGEARGWILEREPEPLLIADMIMVPDFALTRGRRRVYLEIAGYWRPGYRERKVRKLAALRRRVNLVDMIIAAPESARAEFAGLADSFPFLWYTDHPSVQTLLDLLERDYSDRDERLAAVDFERIGQEAIRRRWIPARESMALLHIYSRSELDMALAHLAAEADVRWLPGIGLCSDPWCHELLSSIATWVKEAEGGRLAVPSLAERVACWEPSLGNLADPEVEVLAQMSGCTVARSSLFEAQILAEGMVPAPMPAPESTPARMLGTQPRRAVRRKHSRSQYVSPAIFQTEPADDT